MFLPLMQFTIEIYIIPMYCRYLDFSKYIILISETIECRNLDFELPIIEVIGEENNFETDKMSSKTDHLHDDDGV